MVWPRCRTNRSVPGHIFATAGDRAIRYRTAFGCGGRVVRLFEEQSSLLFSDLTPCARKHLTQTEPANSDANQAKSWVTNRSRHAADLAIFAFDQFQSDPARGNCFTKSNWRIARSDIRLWIENPRPALPRFPALNNQSVLELAQ